MVVNFHWSIHYNCIFLKRDSSMNVVKVNMAIDNGEGNEKREETWHSLWQTPLKDRGKALQKLLMTQRLHVDLGQSVGATKIMQPLWLTKGLRTNLKLLTSHICCEIKRTNIRKFVNSINTDLKSINFFGVKIYVNCNFMGLLHHLFWL